jgi:GAF domain-containing protein
LRRFAREVAFIDRTDVVLSRTVETVERAAKLRCTVFLTDQGGDLTLAADASTHSLQPIERNDGAVVRVLATREPVDLHDVQSALSGDYAFPMFARNRLLGVLVCGGKADGVAAYAPDELEAIGAVAHATGFALDLLRIEALERELAELRIAGVAFPSVMRRT